MFDTGNPLSVFTALNGLGGWAPQHQPSFTNGVCNCCGSIVDRRAFDAYGVRIRYLAEQDKLAQEQRERELPRRKADFDERLTTAIKRLKSSPVAAMR